MDYKNPDYNQILVERARRIAKLRANSDLFAGVLKHYSTHPADFISDWGMTYDPREIESGRAGNIPFVLWPKQREYIDWLYDRWQAGERGLVEKSRDCGVTWLSVGFAAWMWIFKDGSSIGFGSRKESLVDKLGDPDSIFEKIRHFVGQIPVDFMPDDYNPDKHATFMRLVNPSNNSVITGEAGDNIGRGGRKTIQFNDEAAFIEHQESVDKALSQTTNCQIDISTFNGSGNLFYQKWQKFRNTQRHFVFDWRDDPRKDDAWYQRQKEEQTEETVAQEIDRDPLASNIDSFIPARWVKASIDAHIKLGFEATGIRTAGFDPADTGDAKAVVVRHGSIVTQAAQMKEGDITQALPWAYAIADRSRCQAMGFDGDGMGAPVIKTYMMNAAAEGFTVEEYRGSGEVADKKKVDGSDADRLGKTNEDTYLNYRSQTWTWLRRRFELTYNAVSKQEQGMLVNANPEDLISISSECECFNELIAELSVPRRRWTKNGKIAVEAKKDMKKRKVQSPNLADALVIAMSVKKVKKKNTDYMRRYIPHRVSDRAVGY